MHQKCQQGTQFPILSALKIPSCGLDVCIDMTTYIITEGRNFKALLKENNGMTLDSCYLFNVEHGVEYDVDSTYGIYLYYTFLNFAADLMDTCNMSRSWIWQSVSL